MITMPNDIVRSTLQINFKSLLSKPASGEPCNGCGYCCTVGPCQLAQEFLKCTTGPCVALESRNGKNICGLVRNPLGYLFKAANPDTEFSVLDVAPESEAGSQLSENIASALGIGKGCDADDDEESAIWPKRFPAEINA
jgi:hypothetical protein